MYRCIAILLASLLWPSLANAEESQTTMLLRPLQVMCEDIATLESTLDQIDQTKPLNIEDISRLSSGKTCFPSFTFQRIAEVNRTERNGRMMVCYRLWDATQPTAADHGQVWCSVSKAIQTIGQVVASRSGNYKMEIHDRFRDPALSEMAIAKCAEGGRVHVAKKHGAWTRESVLNIDSPQKYPPVPIPNASKLADIIRNGCKGVDYE